MRNLDGAAVGAAAGLLTSMVVAVAGRGENRVIRPGVAGLVVGALAGLAAAGQLDAAVLLAVALAAAGGTLVDRGSVIGGVLVLGLGAAVLSEATPPEPLERMAATWLGPLAFVTVIVGGAAIFAVDRRRPAVTPLLFAVTAGGAAWTLPDTEAAFALFGAALVAALGPLAAPVGWRGQGAFVAAALLAFTAGSGGVGRAESTVAAIAGLGVLVLEPLAVGIGTILGRVPRVGAASDLALVAAQLAAVAVLARVAGVTGDIGDALAVAVLVAIGLLVVLTVAATRSHPRG